MILERRAPAKVNLGLHVLRKRLDGFHDLETIFLPVPWFDNLYVEPAIEQAEMVRFTCSDERLPVDETNLCVKAAKAMLQIAKDRQLSVSPVHLHLQKNLPFGAGLGGGSSDAANTLRLLNAYWKLDVEIEFLHTIAAGLGSDVAFFLYDEPMYAEGRGELLAQIQSPDTKQPYVFPFEMVVVVPPIHVSTAQAYQNISPDDDNREDLCKLMFCNDLRVWRERLVNDFEKSVFASFPAIKHVKHALYDLGAGYAVMSGSGSAVFAIFDDPGVASIAASRMQVDNHAVWCSVQ